MFVFIVTLAFIAPAAQAITVTEEIQVTKGGASNISNQSAPSGDLEKAVKRLSRKTHRLHKAVTKQTEATTALVTSVGDLTTTAEGNVLAVKALDNSLRSEANALGVQNYKNAQAIVILLVLVGLGIVAVILARTSKVRAAENNQPIIAGIKLVADETRAQANKAAEEARAQNEAVLKTVAEGLSRINENIGDIPRRTAEAIKALDPTPFEFEAGGKKVKYQSPKTGIAEGFYLLLHVPANAATVDPSTYERSPETARGIARRSCRQTMQKYFEGAYNAPEYAMQKSLIEHLIATGEISVS